MLSTLFKNIFGSRNARILRRMEKTVHLINSLEPTLKVLSDEQLRAKTAEFERIQDH